MSIIRINHHIINYTVLDKTCLEDRTISWRATGLHAYLMGLPNDWVVQASDLINRKTDGRVSVSSAIAELESRGYIVKSKTRNNNGKFDGWDYTIYERPINIGTSTESSLPDVGQPTSTKEPKSTKYKNITEIAQSTAPDVKSWSSRVMAIWGKRIGRLEPYKLKHVKPLVQEHGQDVVVLALEEYLGALGDMKYASIGRFAETFLQWKDAASKRNVLSDPNRYAPFTRQ